MRRRVARWRVCVALAPLLWAAPAAADGVAVAPFDPSLAGQLEAARDVATRLEGAWSGRVVGPDALPEPQAPVGADARVVREHAEAASVDHVLLLREQESGDAIEIEAQLRSAFSGAALGRYLERADGAEGLPDARAALTARVVADLPEPLPDVAAAGADTASTRTRAATSAPEPIAIHSDELTVIEPPGGERRIVFEHNVVVSQGETVLESDRLEARYPNGASQPEELVAIGDVRVRQGDRRARCDRATYRRVDQTVVCEGNAELVQACDRVRGEKIHFDLERERVRVTGAPSVVIHPEAEPGETSAPGAPQGCTGTWS